MVPCSSPRIFPYTINNCNNIISEIPHPNASFLDLGWRGQLHFGCLTDVEVQEFFLNQGSVESVSLLNSLHLNDTEPEADPERDYATIFMNQLQEVFVAKKF